MNQNNLMINDDQEINENISNKEFYQEELEQDNNENIPIIYQKANTNQRKIYTNPNQQFAKKNFIINSPHYMTQSLAQKLIQDNNGLNITPINDISDLNYTTPNSNQILINNKNNSFSAMNKSHHTAVQSPFNNLNYEINRESDPLTEDNEKLKELAKNIKENENKIDQMNKTMNEILSLKNRNEEMDDARSFITQINDIEKIQQENITLKADSIIYREDISTLYELNNKLTKELEISRKKILDLISRNDDMEKDINHKDYQINKLNEIITRMRMYENPDMEYKIKNNKTKEEILQELEFNIKTNNEEINKLNTEKKILQEKIKNIMENKNNLNRNIILNNEQNNKIINDMDEKIHLLEKEINELNNENNLININNAKNEKEMEKLYIERNNYENKYIKKKEEYDKLQNDYSKLNKKYQQLIYENNRNTILERNKSDMEKKIKKVNKDAINELYNKIQILKSKAIEERNIDY